MLPERTSHTLNVTVLRTENYIIRPREEAAVKTK
jgi:hypothetical protein